MIKYCQSVETLPFPDTKMDVLQGIFLIITYSK